MQGLPQCRQREEQDRPVADGRRRPAGTYDGFNYSAAMKGEDIIWTPENLDKYLADPKGFVPGNKMAFIGLKKEDDRRA